MATDDLVPLVSAEPPPEPGFRPAARKAFFALIRENGKTFHKMTMMCEIQIKQKLSEFPEEQKALVEALRRGIPDKVIELASKDGYDDALKALGEKFSKETGLANGSWAVERWAEGVGRAPGYVAPPPVAPVVERSPTVVSAEKAALARAGMLIVTAAGALGGFLGNGGVLLFLHLVNTGDAKTPEGQAGLIGGTVVLLFLMCFGSIPGALAAFGGWKMGNGGGNPWPTAMAAFGAAFGSGTLFIFGCGIFVAPIAIAFSTFGATFKSAARGGYDT